MKYSMMLIAAFASASLAGPIANARRQPQTIEEFGNSKADRMACIAAMVGCSNGPIRDREERNSKCFHDLAKGGVGQQQQQTDQPQQQTDQPQQQTDQPQQQTGQQQQQTGQQQQQKQKLGVDEVCVKDDDCADGLKCYYLPTLEGPYGGPKGTCKPKSGQKCAKDNDCADGLECHHNPDAKELGAACRPK